MSTFFVLEIFIGILRRMSIKFSNINCFFTDSVLKLMFLLNTQKTQTFQWSYSMLLWERNFGLRKSGMFYCEKRSLYFKEELLRDMQLGTSPGALGSKISGINRFNCWLINRKISFKTRINMRNQLFWKCIFWKNSSYKKVAA